MHARGNGDTLTFKEQPPTPPPDPLLGTLRWELGALQLNPQTMILKRTRQLLAQWRDQSSVHSGGESRQRERSRGDTFLVCNRMWPRGRKLLCSVVRGSVTSLLCLSPVPVGATVLPCAVLTVSVTLMTDGRWYCGVPRQLPLETVD